MSALKIYPHLTKEEITKVLRILLHLTIIVNFLIILDYSLDTSIFEEIKINTEGIKRSIIPSTFTFLFIIIIGTNIFVISKAWATENFSIAPQNWNASQETYASVNAMGTGPFKITLREPNTKTVFKKNKKWWGNVEHNLDSIELLPIMKSASGWAILKSKCVDFMVVIHWII